MADQPDLGRLISVHGINPAALQRGVFIVVLSFLFFLATMLLYYIRQGIGFFLLSTAFLVIYLVTLFSWVMLRRNAVKLYERGFSYRGRSAEWGSVKKVGAEGAIEVDQGKPIILPASLYEIDKVLAFIRTRVDGAAGRPFS